MAVVALALIDEASAALGVSDVKEIGATGGQKVARHVRRGGNNLVMKVAALKSSAPTTLIRADREVELLKSPNSSQVAEVESDLITPGSPVHGAPCRRSGGLPASAGRPAP